MTTESQAEKIEELTERVAELEHQHHEPGKSQKTIRWQSQSRLLGYPLCDVAFGPGDDGSIRGHAKGIIAVGDIATGGLAIGGLAQGVIAIGGLSWGIVAVGGCAVGLAAVLAGVGLGGFAVGGVAVGLKALGGVAVDPGWFQ